MPDLTLLQAALEEKKIPFSRNEPLQAHTTFRIGGPAKVFCKPRNVAELRDVLSLCREQGERIYLLGKGSNILFADEGFDGVVVSLLGLDSVSLESSRIRAAAGVPLNGVCRLAQENGLTGLEFAYGIPGCVGGAVYMNAGAYGGEIKDVLTEVTILDETGELRTLAANQLELGYRTSIFERMPWCVVEAVFTLRPGNREEIHNKMNDLLGRRKEKQPLEYPSAGSTFKRPEGAYAGALIEQCGLKGYQVGGAAVSRKHCGFVVNVGGATCADVVKLTEEVSCIVKEKTGFTLEREIRVVR